MNLTFVEAILAKRGVSVSSVPDGHEALRALEREEFDIVLMDVQMPGMDGYEATRALRARGNRVPVIGLTAHALPGDREKCLAAGMDDFLTKPVSPAALYRKLAAWAKGCRGVCRGEEPEPPADLEKLRQGLGGDAAVLSALTYQLRATSDELLPEMERAARENDPDSLQRAAHKLRGGLLVFDARDAVTLADELEHVARDGRTQGADLLIRNLRSAVELLLAYLERAKRGEPRTG